MEKDKNISSSDSYTQIEGDDKEIIQVTGDILSGKIMILLSTKSTPRAPVKITKKNLKKYLK